YSLIAQFLHDIIKNWYQPVDLRGPTHPAGATKNIVCLLRNELPLRLTRRLFTLQPLLQRRDSMFLVAEKSEPGDLPSSRTGYRANRISYPLVGCLRTDDCNQQ